MAEKCTILIVEDEPIVVECLQRLLEYHGFSIVGSCDKGSDAISKAKELQPQIILMDIMLKDSISGCDAALEIRKYIDTKIIFLTGYSSNDVINYVASSDADGYIMKPYLEKQILATIALAKARDSIKEQTVQNSGYKKNIISLNHGFTFDRKLVRLFKDGQEIQLSKKALRLVKILSENINISISFEQISQYVYEKQVCKKTLRSLVYRTRQSLGADLIESSSGLGYKILSDDMS